MRIRINRRKIQWLLQIQKKVLRTCQYTHNIPEKTRPNTQILYTSVVGRHRSSNTRQQTRQREEISRCFEQARKSRLPSQQEKSKFL